MSLGLLGCHEKRRDIVTDMYPEEQKKLESIVKDIFITTKNKDLARLDSYHLNSPKFTKFEESEIFTRRDFQEARKGENDFVSTVSDFVYEVQDFKADVFGHAAITTFYLQFSGKMGDTPVAGRVRGTLVFVRVGDDWKIVHEHFSLFPTTPG
jgi:ketosteroid isomerase-like protein